MDELTKTNRVLMAVVSGEYVTVLCMEDTRLRLDG